MVNEIGLDLALNAGYMLAQKEIEIEDSRMFLLEVIPELTAEFQKRYSDDQLSEDYITLIDAFSQTQLVEKYGRKEDDLSDEIAIIRWDKDDLLEVFSNNKIPLTDDNINKFMNTRSPRTLEERSIEEGWEILDILVTDMMEEFDLIYSSEDLAKHMIDIYWAEGTLETEIAEEWFEFLSDQTQLGTFESIFKILDTYFEDPTNFDVTKLVPSITSVLKEINPDYYLKAESQYILYRNM
jgi:hypothetical protein